MKRIPTLVALLATLSVSSFAQTSISYLEEDLQRSAGIYNNYETFGIALTPAPRGFKPFYISHYGRHGSRYHTGANRFTETLREMSECSKAGILTKEGTELYESIKKLESVHDGLFGMLTQKGSIQHQRLADRMYFNFRRVFRQKDRCEIVAISSPVQRCIQSMANFCTQLSEKEVPLNFHYYSGDRYMDILAHGPVSPKGFSQTVDSVVDSLVALIDVRRLSEKTFTDTGKAEEVTGVSAATIFYNCYRTLAISPDLDEEDTPDILFSYYNTEELFRFSRVENCRFYADWLVCAEFGDARPKSTAVHIIRDIIEKADAAVKGNNVAADLRFGHDSGLTPLLSYIRLRDNDWVGPIGQSADHWNCFREMCMCSNLQMIFYRNRKGEVLVKFLHNERETRITGLPTYSGPYYQWSVLRSYLTGLLN